MKKPQKPWRLVGFCDRHLFRSLNVGSVTDLDATKNKKSHRAAALCYIKSFLQNPHAPPSVQRSVRNAE